MGADAPGADAQRADDLRADDLRADDVATYDVVVVGAGPTGLTAAHLCARVGLSAVVLERREGPQRSPAAHVVNARTFEIWRQAGIDMAPLFAACSSPADAGTVFWVDRLGGDVIGSLPFERQGDEMLAVTPTPLRNLSQHRLEPLLLTDHLDVRYEHSWVGADQDSEGLDVQVEGPDGPYRLRAKYLLAADGAGSPVRRWLGIEPIGPRSLQSFLMVHLHADLRDLVAEHRGVLYFNADPATGGTFVNHGIDRDWVYMHPWDPEQESVEAFTEERSRQLVLSAMARDDVEFDILGTSTWHMSAQIAERYGDGRVFLVGDAAHRFPPTGGLGLNTGVADAHNLVWKLAAVEDGWASPDVLRTYELERKPVAQFNCDQSLANAFKLIEVPIALGVTADIAESTAAMHQRLADPTSRAEIEAAIANQAIHFDLLGLQLGHAYDGPLVISDGSAPPVLREPARDYVPGTRPGGRLPHAWLPDGSSTLDLVDAAHPTVLLCEGASYPAAGTRPVLARHVDRSVWSSFLDLDADTALVVRPDQHVAYRGPVHQVDAALAALFPQAVTG